MSLTKERPRAFTWRDRLEPIMATPCEWYRVEEYAAPQTAYSKVSALRRGATEVPPGKWEFRASNVNGRGVVYAMYLGPKNEEVLA